VGIPEHPQLVGFSGASDVNALPHRNDAFPLDLDDIASNRISDETIRKVVRFGLARELWRLEAGGISAQLERKMQLIQELRKAPLAVHADAANEQHYEVNTDLFKVMLGSSMKYSCALWSETTRDLNEAQAEMLNIVFERAGLQDGQTILDLGCGWGSLTLYLAERLPSSQIVALSNSRSQKAYIDSAAIALNLANIEVHTANIADWDTATRFDRIVSIEMFEHLRNYELLFAKIRTFLAQRGKLFVQIMSHLRHAYLVQDNWMAEHFFTGGIIPSDDLFLYFQRDLLLDGHWTINGTHYRRTAQAWLDRIDAARERAMEAFCVDRTEVQTARALANWRLYLLSCIETFGYRDGKEWIVSHYLFENAQ
jgi:cyclopropane-fatty-acyl-phospholipid synthase